MITEIFKASRIWKFEAQRKMSISIQENIERELQDGKTYKRESEREREREREWKRENENKQV